MSKVVWQTKITKFNGNVTEISANMSQLTLNVSYSFLNNFRDEQRRFFMHSLVKLYLDKFNYSADQSIKLDKMGHSIYCHPCIES